MKRAELEHIIRAAGTIARVQQLIIVGSQSILGKYPEAEGILVFSMEADIYPPEDLKMSDVIDGCIGELSPFHEQFGYYAQGVGPETAVLPTGWESRLVKICNENTNGIEGMCLHPLDLAISKLVAFREKDKLFLNELINQNYVQYDKVKHLIKKSDHLDQELLLQRLDVTALK